MCLRMCLFMRGLKLFGKTTIIKGHLMQSCEKRIENSLNSLTVQYLKNDSYLLYNLLHDVSRIDSAILITDVIYFECYNINSEAADIVIERAYSKTPDVENILNLNHIEARIPPNDEGTYKRFNLKVAYVCDSTQPASLRYFNFMNYTGQEEPFNLLDYPERAAEVVNFIDSAYLVTMKGQSETLYESVLHLQVDERGILTHKNHDDGDIYIKLFEQAKTPVGSSLWQSRFSKNILRSIMQRSQR